MVLRGLSQMTPVMGWNNLHRRRAGSNILRPSRLRIPRIYYWIVRPQIILTRIQRMFLNPRQTYLMLLISASFMLDFRGLSVKSRVRKHQGPKSSPRRPCPWVPAARERRSLLWIGLLLLMSHVHPVVRPRAPSSQVPALNPASGPCLQTGRIRYGRKTSRSTATAVGAWLATRAVMRPARRWMFDLKRSRCPLGMAPASNRRMFQNESAGCHSAGDLRPRKNSLPNCRKQRKGRRWVTPLWHILSRKLPQVWLKWTSIVN